MLLPFFFFFVFYHALFNSTVKQTRNFLQLVRISSFSRVKSKFKLHYQERDNIDDSVTKTFRNLDLVSGKMLVEPG